MARTNNLTDFLTDVAGAIREKKGTEETIQASDFDTEITNLPSGGGDISEFFDTNIVMQTDFHRNNIKKLPSLTIDDRITSMQGYFSAWYVLEEIENISGGTNVLTYDTFFSQCRALKKVNFNNFNTSNSTSFNTMFSGCGNLTNLDLSNFTSANVTNTSNMFLNCKLLTHIDMRNMTFDNVTSHTKMFGANSSSGPADDCEIIVKSQTEKEWITSKFSRLTNVKTVEEYEAE